MAETDIAIEKHNPPGHDSVSTTQMADTLTPTVKSDEGARFQNTQSASYITESYDWIPEGFEYSPKLSDGFIKPITDVLYCVRLLFTDGDAADWYVESVAHNSVSFKTQNILQTSSDASLSQDTDPAQDEEDSADSIESMIAELFGLLEIEQPELSELSKAPEVTVSEIPVQKAEDLVVDMRSTCQDAPVATPVDSKPFPILALPTEIRADIFSYLLPKDRTLRLRSSLHGAQTKSGKDWSLQINIDRQDFGTPWYDPLDALSAEAFGTLGHPLLHVNRQLQSEVLGMLLRQNKVLLSNRFEFYDWLDGPGKDLAIPHLNLYDMKWDLGRLRMPEEFSLPLLLRQARVKQLDIDGALTTRAERYVERHWRQKRTKDLFVKVSQIRELTKIRGIHNVTVKLSNWEDVEQAFWQEQTDDVKVWTDCLISELAKAMKSEV